MLIIAADAGPEWESRTRNLMQRMRAISGTPLQLLLADIRTLLEQRISGDVVLRMADGKYFTDRDRIRSADLARLLAGLEGQPWCEWGKTAQPITPHGLAKIMSEANIRPATLRFHTADQNRSGPTITDKGYLTAQFTEAFERYLPGRWGWPGKNAPKMSSRKRRRRYPGPTSIPRQAVPWVPARGASRLGRDDIRGEKRIAHRHVNGVFRAKQSVEEAASNGYRCSVL